VIHFENVDIAFGGRPKSELLSMLDGGAANGEIRARTGAIIGARDVNFSVGKGDICVLMGLSGSGKSTVLRAVNRLNRVTRGRVWVGEGEDRVNIASCSESTLRRMRMNRLATVFQQASLMPWLTVAQNAAFGLQLKGLPREKCLQTAREKLAMVQLAEWEDCYPDQLSGGMQQRVGLARAFATDANILLMDEPFSALDPLIRQELQSELLALQKSVHKTVLFVSHDLDEALTLGNRIAIMQAGRIVQFGRPEEIVLQPATEYIARFVAHINPLNVLRAKSLMLPLEKLPLENGARILPPGCRLKVGADGSLQGIGGGEGPQTTPAVVAPHTPMRELTCLLRDLETPLVVADGGTVLGIIRRRDICSALAPLNGHVH